MQLPNRLPESTEITGTQLKRAFNRLLAVVRSIRPVGSPSVKVSITPSGTTYKTVKKDKRKGGGGGGDTYEGPFTVIKKNDTTVTVKAYDGATYLSKNYIIAGLDRIETSSDTDVTITTSGSIYVKVVHNGTNYVATYHNASSLPAQTAGNYYEELYSVLFSAGAITQLKRSRGGHVRIEGRIV